MRPSLPENIRKRELSLFSFLNSFYFHFLPHTAPLLVFRSFPQIQDYSPVDRFIGKGYELRLKKQSIEVAADANVGWGGEANFFFGKFEKPFIDAHLNIASVYDGLFVCKDREEIPQSLKRKD